MIYMDNLEKFFSLITSLKDQNAIVQLYGHMEEIFSGAQIGWETPPNNTLQIRIVALTSTGIIYCNSHTKLKDSDKIDLFRNIYSQLSVIDADLSYSSESSTVTIR